MISDDSGYLDIEPRDPLTIARRLLVLNSVTQRVAIESHAPGELAADETLFDLRASLVVAGADQEVTANERTLLEAPLGRVSDDDRFDFGWSIESLGALIDALGLAAAIPVPPRLADAGSVLQVFESEPDAQELASRLTVPDPEGAARIREGAELWLWRATAEQGLRDAPATDRARLHAEIAEVAQEASRAGRVDISAGDFASGDRPISTWTDEELASFTLASEARLLALNWLCGFGETWDDVPLEL